MKTIYVNVIDSLEKRKMNLDGNAFKLCGGNTGNVCFTDSVLNQMEFDYEVNYDELSECEENVTLVIPSSTWLKPYSNYP